MRTHVAILISAVVLTLITFSGCKKKAEEKKVLTNEDVRGKVEAAVLNFAKTDEALGEYDSIKFVGYTPYFKSTYCDLMCQLLSIQSDELDPHVQSDSTMDLTQIDEKMARINGCIEYFKKQSYNTLNTKNDPVVVYEAKCYSYTDGYIEEYVYFVTKDWQVIELDPYDVHFLDKY